MFYILISIKKNAAEDSISTLSCLKPKNLQNCLNILILCIELNCELIYFNF